MDFGTQMMVALQAADLLKQYVQLPRPNRATIVSGTGVAMLTAKPVDAEKLNNFLWQNFGIGGTMASFEVLLPPEWSKVPHDENCLLVMENHREMMGSDGQPGEGADEKGRPVPRP